MQTSDDSLYSFTSNSFSQQHAKVEHVSECTLYRERKTDFVCQFKTHDYLNKEILVVVEPPTMNMDAQNTQIVFLDAMTQEV